ncbi:MAG: hypothetical protein AAB267_01050 [Candidatus Desantisbacteria bacterium]
MPGTKAGTVLIVGTLFLPLALVISTLAATRLLDCPNPATGNLVSMPSTKSGIPIASSIIAIDAFFEANPKST